jgi:hypothetical protein
LSRPRDAGQETFAYPAVKGPLPDKIEPLEPQVHAR